MLTIRRFAREDHPQRPIPSLAAHARAANAPFMREAGTGASRTRRSCMAYRALRLNLGTSDVRRGTAARVRTHGLRAEGDAEARGPLVLGVDLGGSAAMSAAVGLLAIDRTARMHWPAFPSSPG